MSRCQESLLNSLDASLAFSPRRVSALGVNSEKLLPVGFATPTQSSEKTLDADADADAREDARARVLFSEPRSPLASSVDWSRFFDDSNTEQIVASSPPPPIPDCRGSGGVVSLSAIDGTHSRVTNVFVRVAVAQKTVPGDGGDGARKRVRDDDDDDNEQRERKLSSAEIEVEHLQKRARVELPDSDIIHDLTAINKVERDDSDGGFLDDDDDDEPEFHDDSDDSDWEDETSREEEEIRYIDPIGEIEILHSYV